VSAVVVVAGLGSPYRGDDAVGPMVAAMVAEASLAARDVGPLEDPLDLLGVWDGVDLAVVVDAVRSGALAGTVRVLEVNPDAVVDSSGGPGLTSTHGIGLAGVLRLARAIDRAPRRLVVVAVEGEIFELGGTMSHAVAAAVPDAVSHVMALIEEVCACA